MSAQKLFFAGSGGQGIILMGQMVTYAAMFEDKQTTYYPSYGPEMRGGTANCTVIVSDKEVSSPLIYEADCLVAMNLPSMLKFEKMVKPGGVMLINSSIIAQKASRSDIRVLEVPTIEIAREVGSPKSANMVMLGAAVRATGVVSQETIERVMREKAFTGKKAETIPANIKAFEHFVIA
ncbi:MAG: 2-oxoacid:acceptor oxidoreductase family protein [Oscillospiraceae bacterium]|jgi:2-oxoglutarate ferredoxin oxidoreductase subunit gamma|nr:2-oxoacid:acceptor oxidoreductase family protein [Oscillospiraceae bacterium]